jgi:hypothetical protein
MPRVRMRPRDMPYTHAHEPSSEDCFQAGVEAVRQGTPLSVKLALDRYAWAGVLSCGPPDGLPPALLKQWGAMVAEMCWWTLPQEEVAIEAIQSCMQKKNPQAKA